MSAVLRSALSAALVIGAAGCDLFGEPKADVANANHYTAKGLAFDYPGNWKAKATDETVEGIELHTIEIESTGSALAMLQQFTPAVPVDTDEVLAEFTAGMREGTKDEMGGIVDYNDGAAAEINRELFGASRTGREKHFVLSALGEKLPHTLHMFPAELDDRTVIIYTQIPDEDRAKASPGFDLILDTLKAQ